MAVDLERSVENLLRIAGIKVEKDGRNVAWCDFIVNLPPGKRVGIAVKNIVMSFQIFEQLMYRVSENKRKLDEYWIVTPSKPAFASHALKQWSGKTSFALRLLSARELPSALGIQTVSQLDEPRTAQALQLAAIEQAESLVPTANKNIDEILNKTSRRDSEEDRLKLTLKRQFSVDFIRTIDVGDPDKVRQALLIGDRVPGVSVLMSDIKNFSHLMKEVPRDEMNKFMAEYYRKARNLVWNYGGTFDKFIGDAVLGIFGYPINSDDAPVRAIKCAQELISMGDELTRDLAQQVSLVIIPGSETSKAVKEEADRIYTGTRIGIATGEIWVLDISVGLGDFQVSFIGDVINLAARLQTGSAVNGILIDQATRYKAENADQKYMSSLMMGPGPDKYKGQKLSLVTHQIGPFS